MNLAINDEVKRLARMITEYLDITRLESGATPMRLAPVRVDRSNRNNKRQPRRCPNTNHSGVGIV